MKAEIETKKCRLAGNMLHIQFEDGHSWLYSLEDVVDYIVTAQQTLALDVCPRPEFGGVHDWHKSRYDEICVNCGKRK